MVVPKCKVSRSNTRSCRVQWKTPVIPAITYVNPTYREPHLSHTVYPPRGQYGTKGTRCQIVEI